MLIKITPLPDHSFEEVNWYSEEIITTIINLASEIYKISQINHQENQPLLHIRNLADCFDLFDYIYTSNSVTTPELRSPYCYINFPLESYIYSNNTNFRNYFDRSTFDINLTLRDDHSLKFRFRLYLDNRNTLAEGQFETDRITSTNINQFNYYLDLFYLARIGFYLDTTDNSFSTREEYRAYRNTN